MYLVESFIDLEMAFVQFSRSNLGEYGQIGLNYTSCHHRIFHSINNWTSLFVSVVKLSE